MKCAFKEFRSRIKNSCFDTEKSGAVLSACVQGAVFWPAFPKVPTQCLNLLDLTLVQANHPGLNLWAITDTQTLPK